ncbi:hypothetical protein FB451DRAFT_1515479 [Mycena latifolia]|nr:hypothetical protein FB451DRAFT_1515479 [Mycena latifolia]
MLALHWSKTDVKFHPDSPWLFRQQNKMRQTTSLFQRHFTYQFYRSSVADIDKRVLFENPNNVKLIVLFKGTSRKPSERPTRIVVVIKQRVIFFRGFDFALGRVSGFYWGSIQVVRVTFGFAAAFAFFRAVWARGTASGLLRGLSHEIYQRYSTNKHEEVVTTKEK